MKNYFFRCTAIFILILSLGAGQLYADTWLYGSFQNWVVKDNDYKFSYDGNIGTYYLELDAATEYEFKIIDGDNYYSMNNANFTTTTTDYLIYTGNGNCKITTGEAGVYVFKTWWADNNRHFSIYFPQARLKKQTYIYFDARRETNWQESNPDIRYWYKYYDSGYDVGSVDCNKSNALEDWVYYALVPDNDYVGRIQLNRLNPSDHSKIWCSSDVTWAKDRTSSAQNCLKEESGKEDFCNSWTPQWTTYCPPMSSVTMADNGTTNWGGDGSSATPYLVPTGGDIKVHVTASASALDDANMTPYFLFKKEGSAVGSGAASTEKTITASSTTGTKEAVIVEAYNYYNSTEGTHLSSTAIYYEARTPYTISYNKGTPAASISGSRESEIKLKDVTFTLPGAVFTRTGYTQTGWATSNGGAKAYELSASYTDNAALALYPVWTPKPYTINLEGMEADSEEPIQVNVTYDGVLSQVTPHTKTNYTFDGYWVRNESTHALETQLIDANGNWIADVTGYTGNDGAGNPTWIHDYAISLYAKWTEIKHTVAVAVSPAGAGTVQVSGENITEVANVGYVTHSPVLTAVPTNAAWVFKEWQKTASVNFDLEHHSTTSTTMEIMATADEQTITAVFEPRYGLIGSLNEDGDPAGGMPNKNGVTWGTERSADYEADFEVVGFTALGTGDGTGVDLQCTRSLLANKQYKFQVVDRSTIGRDRFCLEENGSAVLEEGNSVTLTYKEKGDANVLINTGGEGNYTFKITNISNDGNYYPTLIVIRPQQVNFGQKYQDVDGVLHEGTIGGSVAVAKTAGGALSSGDWVTYNTSVTHTATATSPGYTFAGWWNSDAFTGKNYSTTNPMTYAVIERDNAYAQFIEIPTTVTLSNDGHGHVEINGATVTSTTVGVTTHRELTAVPDEGYKFNSWTKVLGDDITLSSTSENPTTLSANGAGAAGQEVRANFVERWALSAQSEGWGSAEFSIANVSIVAGKAIGYVDIALPANTDMQFKMVDKLTGDDYMNGSNQVYYMTNGNSHNWSFATDKTWNCGITTAGAGTYRFIWNITDKKMTVTYPNFVIYRTGDKADDPRAQYADVESYAGGRIDAGIEFRMKVQTIDQWYSLSLPFAVSSVKVWDDEDGAYYDIVPYYRTGGKFYTGHYIIRKPETVTNYAIETFEERWVDPENSGVLPEKNIPYIIQWHDPYFLGKYISFFGSTNQAIPSDFNAGEAPSADDVVNVFGNNTMHSGTVRDAYLLDKDYGPSGAWLREDIGTDRTILPFECFIRASQQGTARYRIIRRGMEIDTPTALEQISNHQSPMTIRVYTIIGVLVGEYNDCSFQDAAHRIATDHNEGIYILRSENESMKLLLGGK